MIDVYMCVNLGQVVHIYLSCWVRGLEICEHYEGDSTESTTDYSTLYSLLSTLDSCSGNRSLILIL